MPTTTSPVITLGIRADQIAHALENPTFVKNFVPAQKTAETVSRGATASRIVRQKLAPAFSLGESATRTCAKFASRTSLILLAKMICAAKM